MYRSTSKITDIVQGKIMEISQTAALLMDGDKISALQIGDNKEGSPRYQDYKDAYDTLAAFKTTSFSEDENNAGLAYIYCLVMTEDRKIVFSIDPSDDPGVFLEEETIYTDAVYKAFEGVAGFDDVSYEDRWGNLYSAYAPIYGRTDATKNTVMAVIGTDVWASWYLSEIRSSAIMILVVTLVTISLGVLATVFVTRKMRKRLTILGDEMGELQGDIKLLISDIHDSSYIESNGAETVKEGDLVKLRKQINDTKVAVKSYLDYAHKQAYVDALTGLGNRNAYFLVVEDLNKKIQDKVYVNFASIVFDINGLKEINDVHGHEAGDKAIIVIGNALKNLFGPEITFRIGGDEMVVIYQNVYEETIKEKLSKLEGLIKEGSEKYELDFDLSPSYGYSFFKETKDTRYEDVFNKADEKMYQQKSLYYEKKKPYRRKDYKE